MEGRENRVLQVKVLGGSLDDEVTVMKVRHAKRKQRGGKESEKKKEKEKKRKKKKELGGGGNATIGSLESSLGLIGVLELLLVDLLERSLDPAKTLLLLVSDFFFFQFIEKRKKQTVSRNLSFISRARTW